MKAHHAIDYKNELNEAQFKAVTSIDGPQLVIAGAGTGKTRTLIYRVAYLVEQGVNPGAILLLTFTRKAAQEMMRRATDMLDSRCSMVSGGTFHSFANMVLRRYAPYLDYNSRFTIVDRSDAEDILNLLRADLGLAKKERRFPRKAALLKIHSRVINTGRSYEEVLDEEYPQFVEELDQILQIAQSYQQYKQAHSIMDYDDLLVHLEALLREHESVRRRLSRDYSHIMVDEFQDTNRLQAQIAYFLAAEHQNIMVVGDDCQSIYSFRGANFRNIMDFPKHFSDCIVTTLEQNYRSTQPILSLTNAIIANASEKYEKNLFSGLEGEEKPIYIRPASEERQALFVRREILAALQSGIPAGEIAVLFRAGWHSNELELVLTKAGIDFVKYGGMKFIESAHIKDLLALLRVVFNPHDSVAWHRVLLLLEGIGPTTSRKIIRQIITDGKGLDALVGKPFNKRKYGGELARLKETLEQVSQTEGLATEKVDALLEFYQPLFELKYDDARKRINDLNSLVQIAENYRDLESLLSDLTLEPPEQSLMGPEAGLEAEHRIVLSTIHSAKGLEWHTVFLIHLVDGYLPSSYSFFNEEGMEEERRLFYVATTRAKRKLYLSAPRVRSRNPYYGFDASEPSRFLDEIHPFGSLTRRIKTQN